MTRLRFGILSTAVINDDMLPAFAATEVADVTAIASRELVWAEQYAQARGIDRAYGSYRELLDAHDVDAVYIPLPNSLHHEWTSAALDAGKHVLCEKPLTIRADEAAELFAQADRRGLVLMEAFMYRHHPIANAVEDIVRSGQIGEVQSIRSHFSFTVADPENDIRLSAQLGGGALRDVGCYCISFGRLVAGEDPEFVASHQLITPTEVDERTTALLEYPGGATGTFDVSIRSPLAYGATVVGSDAVLSIPSPWYAHNPPHAISIARDDGATQTLNYSSRNSYELEIENFCRAVHREEAPRITAEETIGVLATLEQIEAAAMRTEHGQAHKET
ncbi:MAG TPA: Gfo/Idh/MocA family oxidoreductase [Gaiellales bacterium]|nr:Gfo/Idh/MocA family oxidoreductase [Gaiellales bacterium]